MSLIGIHESRQGSEIISIRVKQYSSNDGLPIDIGLGPDDIVTLQKKLEKKSDKGNKSKNQEQDRQRRLSSNEKSTNSGFDLISNKKITFEQTNMKKNEVNSQIKNDTFLLINNSNNKLYSHSPGGFNLNSQAAFPAYFSELLRRSTPTQKKPFWHSLFRPRTNSANPLDGISVNKTSYDDGFVSKGYYYSYNAFTHKDIVVTVDNPGGCQTMMINEKGEFENDLTNDDWRQVCLSSKLRFYRCSQPILASFMFSKPIMTVCYYIYEIPYMNSDDFEYCMEHYNHDPFSSNDDFEMSVAMALIVNCDLKYVLKFIEKYDSKFPRLLLHVIKHIAPSSRFCKMLIPILTNHMMLFSDDLDIAIIFFDIALANMKFDVCMKLLIPLLKSSIWVTPQCGVSIARFCIKNNLFEESLEFLNLACVVNAKKQKKFGFNNQKSQLELLRSLPRSKSLSESSHQSKSQTFYRSTSMTLSIKNKKKENDNSSNDYEYDIDNENYYGLNDALRISLSSSPSSRFNSPQNSRKNSYMEEKNANYNNEDDEFISSSKQSSKVFSPNIHGKNSYNDGFKLNSPHSLRKNSYIEEKIVDDFKLNSPHSLRKNSYIEDNLGKHQRLDLDCESLSSSRPSSRLSSGHSSRKNSYIEDANQKEMPDYLDSDYFENDIYEAYMKSEKFMTNPVNSLNYGPSQSSRILLQNHFVTLKSQILFTLSEFIDKLGEAEFEAKKDEFIKGRPMADEEEMIFDDDEEIYTSYFYPESIIKNEEEEEEEKFKTLNDENEFSQDLNNLDIADNDNYDYYVLSNENDLNQDLSIIDKENSSIIDKENSSIIDKENSSISIEKIDNNNINNTEDNDNKNDKDKKVEYETNIRINNSSNMKSSPYLPTKTNTITIPEFPHSGIFKKDLFSNIKSFASKAKSRVFFKINDSDNDSNKNVTINLSQKASIDSLPPMALFDPGIEASFNEIPSLPDEISRSMPVSNFFLECLSEIRKDYVESMLILAHQKDVTMSTQTTILFIALATNDKRLMEAMLNSFTEENRATGTDKLILLRGFTMNVTSNLEAILTVPLEPLTVIEKNALAFMEPFAIGVHRLNNTEL